MVLEEEKPKNFAIIGVPEYITDVITIEDVRTEFSDGLGLIRASNTQPILVMCFDALKEYEQSFKITERG